MSDLTVRELMTANVVTVHRRASLTEVQELMREGRFRHVPVVDDDDEVVGVISDRDLVRIIGRSSFSKAVEALGQLTAERAMSAPVETVDPEELVREAAERMLDGKLGCLPVVEGRHLVGIVTEADFVRHVARADE